MDPVNENRMVRAIEVSRTSLRRAAWSFRGYSAIVCVSMRGEYEVVQRRRITGEVWLRMPREAYVVDIAPHLDTFEFQLPSMDEASSFSATVAVEWHVADPISAVRARLESPKEEIKEKVEESLRAISRKFAVEQWDAAWIAFRENLRSIVELVGGVVIDSCEVKLKPGDEPQQHMEYLKVPESDYALLSDKDQLALRLARSRHDAGAAIELLMEQRGVDVEDAKAILASLLEAGLVNRTDVAAILADPRSTVAQELNGTRVLDQADIKDPREPVADSVGDGSPDLPGVHSSLAAMAGTASGEGELAPVAASPQTDSTEPPLTASVGGLDTEILPVVVYLADAAHAAGVEQALEEMLSAFGGAIVLRDPPVMRSWFRRMGVKFRHAVGSDAVRRLGRDLDRAVELRAVDEIQAKVDAAQGDAAAKLLTALAETPTALIQIGSVLLVKINGIPIVRNLTQAELIYLQRNPDVVRDPADCLTALQRAAEQGLNDQAGVDAGRATVERGLVDGTVSSADPHEPAAQ